MPHRKLVRIGEPSSLPTIAQFLSEMAARQHNEIQRLKSEALSGKLPDPTVPEEHHDELRPDAWQLHPVRIKTAPRAGAKKSRKTSKSASGSNKPKSLRSKKTVPKPKKAAPKPKSGNKKSSKKK